MIIISFQLVTLIRSAPAEKLVGGGFNSFELFLLLLLLLLLLLAACSKFLPKLPPTNNNPNFSSSASLIISLVINCPPLGNHNYEAKAGWMFNTSLDKYTCQFETNTSFNCDKYTCQFETNTFSLC